MVEARESLKLQCSDDEVIVADLEDAKMSTLIAGMVEDEGTEEAIPITQINKGVMERILQFCAHVRESGEAPQIVQPLPSNDLAAHLTDQWYATYIIEGVD